MTTVYIKKTLLFTFIFVCILHCSLLHAEQERAAAATETARLAAVKAEEDRKTVAKAEEQQMVQVKTEQQNLTPGTLRNSGKEQIVKSEVKRYFKHVDRNGFEFWLDSESSIPPIPPPIYYKYEDINGFVFWVDDVSKIPEEYRLKNTQDEDRTVKSETVVVPNSDQKPEKAAKSRKSKKKNIPAKPGAIKTSHSTL